MLHSWMGYDPFEPIIDLKVYDGSIACAAIDHSDQFADITILRFRRGVTAAGFAHAGELNRSPSSGLGEFMEASIDDEGLQHLSQWINVRHLFFNGCPKVTDAAPSAAPWSAFPKLEMLELFEEGGDGNRPDAGLCGTWDG